MMFKTRRLSAFKALSVLACAVLLVSCTKLGGLVDRAKIKSGLLTPARSGKAHLDVYGSIPVLHLYGTPAEMGEQYGALLKTSLRALHGYMHAFMPEDQLERYLDFARGQEKNLPAAMRTELKAIAAAAGVPYVEIVALNVTPRLRCTALAMWGKAARNGNMILGRNMDYFSVGLGDRGSLVIVYHAEGLIPVAAVSFIGMNGAYTGVNEKGVAFGNLLVFNAADNGMRKDGLCIQLILREAAHKCSTASEMAEFIRKRKHIIPVNVITADAREAKSVELGLRDSHVWNGQKGVLAVSNHFRARKLYDVARTCRRYDSLLRSAAKNYGRFDVEIMGNALYAARVKDMNLQAVVFEPEAMLMHLSMNRMPASKGPYRKFDLRRLFKD